ncbi:family 10 glycosylhydrolase [Gramella jeungdoensis]|uniref:Family 10 glycosylhydrolase n=1 Tax=Gramella jeungdoensis TaxID=708091 RepID=A0ABT0Z1T2_9FLAO|nr:family 10 glycosylhydrolase [Gramella jeungdoensis]MCM8569672.1 family 10 glycosylhydrolase [Gramella jeungdoensis]
MLRHSVRFLVYLTAIFLASCKTTKPVSQPAPPVTEKTTQDTIVSEEPQTPVVVPKTEKTEENQQEKTVKKIAPPLDIYEFRAAWVATVANINWPSKPGLSTSEQQREALKLLDFLQENNFNAVIFQVRPQTDALYDSELEPWSYFLTGKQGKAPEPYYDPLKFWIEAAHNRGLELHVWLNPYRAHHTTGGEISESSIIKRKPELAVKLENGMWWLDPAKQGTQDHSAAVVMDLVKRYDLDGVHFDDYFYPYDSYNNGKDFPDDDSWNTYKNNRGELSRADWRRHNVNHFIRRVYDEIKTEKPFVKFGLSPFGIWRPGYPQSITGYDQYEKLYADAKLWLNEGWIDYFTPQLYWKINQEGQSFPELLGWWERENNRNRHLWPGINVGLGGDEKNIDETINQIMITRGMLPESKGTVHWSIGPLVKHDSLSTALKQGPYKKKTLVPSSPWLDDEAPEIPQVQTTINNERIQINWTHPDRDDVFRWVIYFKYEGGNWDYKILNGDLSSYSLQYIVGEKKKKMEQIGLTAVDRTGNQSEFKAIILK